jgi:hypothetical protein
MSRPSRSLATGLRNLAAGLAAHGTTDRPEFLRRSNSGAAGFQAELGQRGDLGDRIRRTTTKSWRDTLLDADRFMPAPTEAVD